MASAFEAKGLTWTDGTSYYRNDPVYRLHMPHSDDARYFPMTNLQQYYIETGFDATSIKRTTQVFGSVPDSATRDLT